jgi:hypothetical protein
LRSKCIAPAADGASCDFLDGPECLPPAQCISGKCLVPDPTACR